ncbi:hypothetical protein B566_EDAN011642 [Ephemera danica]|nr:hypothetical protein B566_EDAN011642 [Ephemera danica]
MSKAEAKLRVVREHEEELQTKHLEQSRLLGTMETRATEKAELAAKLQGELETLRKEVATERSDARDSNSQIQQLRSQNNNALKEACSMLDEQLEDSDKVRAAYDTQLAQAKQEMARLQEQLDKAQGDFRAKTAEADELRALRAAVEERLAAARRDADFRASEAQEDIKDLKQQLSEARFASDQLLQQVNELEATLCESDRTDRDQRHIVDALRAKCTSLQEELATTLTDLQTARDAAETLSVRLEAAKQSEKETAARLTEAGAKAAELRVTNEQNILKLKSTIDQQAKLIDFLQSKATLADVLFGSRPKENMAPTPSPLRPAGQMQAPLSAKAAQAAREKARTWEPRTPKAASADIKKGAQQTPVSSKVASVTKCAEPSKPAVETKKEGPAPNASKPAPNLNAPMILDQRVLPEYCRLTINCAVPLSEQVTLLGAEEGLYSSHPRASGFQLVHIAGVTKVKQVVIVPHLGLALFISGSPAVLSQCELRALTVAAEAAQCSKPSVTLKPVEHAPDQCYFSAVSSSMPLRESGGSTATFLCVANPSHVAIMRWNLGSCQFEPVRLLETTHPTASILFTPHSLLLVCDEVFELDLQDFSVEDFLNQADKSLNNVRTALKSKTAPGTVSLLDITKKGPKAEPEYMLCLPDIAVFLDGFGSRSRPGDLKWSHRPQAFVYSSPVLYVQHTTGVLGVRPVDSKLCASNESISTAGSATPTSQELGLLPLSGPRLLGVGLRKGSVLATAHQATATTLLTITAPGLDADDISLSSEIESGRDEFSFTSSLENSLEGDVLHDANKKVQFA